MVPAAHDGPTTTDTQSDYDFGNFNPTNALDHILVNRLRKQQRNSTEPIDKEQAMEILKKSRKSTATIKVDDKPDLSFNKSSSVLMRQNT